MDGLDPVPITQRIDHGVIMAVFMAEEGMLF